MLLPNERQRFTVSLEVDDAQQPGLQVEVVFATPAQQVLLSLRVPDGCTLGAAIDVSGIRSQFPDIDFDALATGVWGQRAERERLLRHGDRVEIYRPLRMDPREARRKLAEIGGAMGQKPTTT